VHSISIKEDFSHQLSIEDTCTHSEAEFHPCTHSEAEFHHTTVFNAILETRALGPNHYHPEEYYGIKYTGINKHIYCQRKLLAESNHREAD
jgi:hypothetical protein